LKLSPVPTADANNFLSAALGMHYQETIERYVVLCTEPSSDGGVDGGDFEIPDPWFQLTPATGEREVLQRREAVLAASVARYCW
jgi:hypothetical protein